MKKTLCILLVLFLVLVSVSYAQTCSMRDIESIVQKDGELTRQKISDSENTFIEKSKEELHREFNDFIQFIEKTSEVIIITTAVSLFGLILLINGIIGWYRVKKEKEIMLLLDDKLNNIVTILGRMTGEGIKRNMMKTKESLEKKAKEDLKKEEKSELTKPKCSECGKEKKEKELTKIKDKTICKECFKKEMQKQLNNRIKELYKE